MFLDFMTLLEGKGFRRNLMSSAKGLPFCLFLSSPNPLKGKVTDIAQVKGNETKRITDSCLLASTS